MKKYNVTVNGVVYEVVVEEADGTAVSAPAAAAPKASGAQGSIKVVAPMPGTILKLNVKVGDTLKANDLVCILEAMKMENEIFTAEGGVVKSIEAAQGASVNAGDVIITLG